MPLLRITHQPQRRQADCLAACAKMVLDYHHIGVTYDRLTELLKISDAGAPFRNLSALTAYRLDVTIQHSRSNETGSHNNPHRRI